MITGHGIYTIPDDEYHADPWPGGSLSCSEARLILDCPAKYWWGKHNETEHKATFDIGHAAHLAVLGVGAVDVHDWENWRTAAAREAQAASYANGRAPVLTKEWAVVEEMADQIRAHPIASRLLDPEYGTAEQSLFWQDQSGVTLRSRVDWLPVRPAPTKRLVLVDYKTARSADTRDFGRAAAEFGYHQQAAWYSDGITALWQVREPGFLFIVQEKTPPYVVNVIELDELALSIGRERNRRAIEMFVECTRSGVWPGYSTGIEVASLPRWAEFQHIEEFSDASF